MSKKRFLKRVFIAGAAVLLLLYVLFQISKSRSFQFFGEIVDRVATSEKFVALTFDDAPSIHTEAVLELIHQREINATFYVIGRDLEKNMGLGKLLIEGPNELGNHSYSHERFYFKSQSEIAGEIEKTNDLIRKLGYEGEITFRPPNGKKLFGLPWYLSKKKIRTVMWDVEPDTYLRKSGDDEKDARFIVDYVKEKARPGSIILLHPFCESCGADRLAITRIVDALREKGYEFVTVSKLLSLSNK